MGEGVGDTVTDVVELKLREDTEDNEGGWQGLESAQVQIPLTQFLVWEHVPGGDGTVLTVGSIECREDAAVGEVTHSPSCM